MRQTLFTRFFILVFAMMLFLAAAPITASNQTLCPVMKGPINKQYYADHSGQRVYFCCPSCKAEFAKDPEKYVKQMKESGTVLEAVPAKK